MITHAASRKQYTVLLDRPEGISLFSWWHMGYGNMTYEEKVSLEEI